MVFGMSMANDKFRLIGDKTKTTAIDLFQFQAGRLLPLMKLLQTVKNYRITEL